MSILLNSKIQMLTKKESRLTIFLKCSTLRVREKVMYDHATIVKSFYNRLRKTSLSDFIVTIEFFFLTSIFANFIS